MRLLYLQRSGAVVALRPRSALGQKIRKALSVDFHASKFSLGCQVQRGADGDQTRRADLLALQR